jgi:hypothetical protein
MEDDRPYWVAPSQQGSPDRYTIKRKGDRSTAGEITKREDEWEVEEARESSGNVRFSRQPNRPDVRVTFKKRCEAELFVYMCGRAYDRREYVVEEQAWIEIRVSPSFGPPYDGCVPGRWAASLYWEDGRRAGGDCCSDSVEGAKLGGLRLAHYKTNPPPTERMERISKEDWQDKDLKACP